MALTSAVAGLWGGGISAGANLLGGFFAARAQAKAQREALAFQKRLAQNDFANTEVTRHANYDQWAARERRIGSIGEMLGWGAREIPAYVGGVNPYFETDGRPTVPLRSRPMAGSVGSYL